MVNKKLARVAGVRMSRRSPLSMEESMDGCNCSCYGGRCYGCYGKEAKESSMLLGDEDNLGEQWLNRENSQVEHRSLFHLEWELDATLWFEHGDGSGGGLKASQLLVTHIVLGRLFRERLVLGQAVKMYAWFQCREIMRCMVKINDLEELSKLPLSGTLGASTSGTPKDDTMDMEESVGLQEEAKLAAQFSLGEAHTGHL